MRRGGWFGDEHTGRGERRAGELPGARMGEHSAKSEGAGVGEEDRVWFVICACGAYPGPSGVRAPAQMQTEEEEEEEGIEGSGGENSVGGDCARARDATMLCGWQTRTGGASPICAPGLVRLAARVDVDGSPCKAAHSYTRMEESTRHMLAG